MLNRIIFTNYVKIIIFFFLKFSQMTIWNLKNLFLRVFFIVNFIFFVLTRRRQFSHFWKPRRNDSGRVKFCATWDFYTLIKRKFYISLMIMKLKNWLVSCNLFFSNLILFNFLKNSCTHVISKTIRIFSCFALFRLSLTKYWNWA